VTAPFDERGSGRMARRTLGGFGWMAMSGGAQTAMQIVVLAVLARLVSPAEFGIVSAALVVVALTAVFAEAGMGPALVQRDQITDRHIRTGLTFQVLASIGLWALVWALAAVIAGLFRIPALAAVVPVIASSLVLRSLTLGEFLLLRELDFRKVAVVEAVSWGLGNGVVAVTLALRGYGAWAIVYGNVAQAAIRTLMLWRARPHAVRPLLDRAALRDLLFYGGGYTLGWWANFVARQGDNVIVGRWLGSEALGLYTRAYSLMRQPADLFGRVVNRVLFPAMAAVQGDRSRLRRSYLHGAGLVAAVVLPFSAVAALTSTELITVLLGERWLALRPAFDVMVFGMLFRTSYKLSDSLASATGRVYARAWRQGVYAAMVVGGAMLGRPWGITGVALGITLALAANFLLMAQLSLEIIDSEWRALGLAHVPGLVLGTLTWAAVGALTMALRAVDAPAVVIVLAGLVATAATGVLTARAAPHSRRGRELVRPVAVLVTQLREGSGVRRTALRILGSGYVREPTPEGAA
jgi:O-antigen/teichoic acid export membrane protein